MRRFLTLGVLLLVATLVDADSLMTHAFERFYYFSLYRLDYELNHSSRSYTVAAGCAGSGPEGRCTFNEVRANPHSRPLLREHLNFRESFVSPQIRSRDR